MTVGQPHSWKEGLESPGQRGLFLALDDLLSSSDVLVSEEEGVFDADVVVDVVEVSCVLAWNGVFREGAGECQLVEDCLVAAEEAVVKGLLVSVSVCDGVAHVEDLAVVVYVGVVTVTEAFAVEVGVDGSNDELNAIWEEESLSLHSWQSHCQTQSYKSDNC